MPLVRDPNVMRRLSVMPPNFFLKYYKRSVSFLTLEGVLKISSVVACIVWSVLAAWTGASRCAGHTALVSVAAPLCAGCVVAAVLAAAALRLPLRAPLTFFYVEVSACGVCGLGLLVASAFGIALCEHTTALDYTRAVWSVLASCTVIGGCVATYAAVASLLDGAGGVGGVATQRRAPPAEDEV